MALEGAIPAGALLDIARQLLPGVDLGSATAACGQHHDVLLLPQIAAVRVSRHPLEADSMVRRVDLLRRLTDVSLPFKIPEPITRVIDVDGRAAVATSWVPGDPRPPRQPDPDSLGLVLRALAEIDVVPLGDVLARPHAYAGGDDWYRLMVEDAIPRLPLRLHQLANQRVDEAAALSPSQPCLVHGDLAGENVTWDDYGRIVGVLDWDLASAFDQAVDVACLADYGWESVRRIVDGATFWRARTWRRTFGIGQIAAAVLSDVSEEQVDERVKVTVEWLDSEPQP